jgi:hypothetical protein
MGRLRFYLNKECEILLADLFQSSPQLVKQLSIQSRTCQFTSAANADSLTLTNSVRLPDDDRDVSGIAIVALDLSYDNHPPAFCCLSNRLCQTLDSLLGGRASRPLTIVYSEQAS